MIDARKSFALIQRGYFTFTVTALTRMMHWLAVCHFILQCADKYSRWKLVQLVALLFCLHIFKLHNACFKFAYLIAHRQFIHPGCSSALVGGHDLSLQFDYRLTKFDSIPDLNKALSQITSTLQE